MTIREAELRILDMRRDFGRFSREEEEALDLAQEALGDFVDLQNILRDSENNANEK